MTTPLRPASTDPPGIPHAARLDLADVRISFGPRPDDTMPATWASRGLTWLREHKPQIFAQMMFAVLDIQRGRE